MPPFEAGQRWAYNNRPQDEGSTIVIGIADIGGTQSATVHITVHGVSAIGTISHMPFSAAALTESIRELLETGVPPAPDFLEGHATWAEQSGGTFTVTVADALDLVVDPAPTADAGDPEPDGFDELVIALRETRSEKLIDDLYRRLFSLEQWFFVCEPDDAQVPVQWVFPDGSNPAPALLAFTSRRRALEMATVANLYPEGANIGVMEPTVAAAVEWITSDGCSNEWLCFNYTGETFPLYVDDAVGLHQAIQEP